MRAGECYIVSLCLYLCQELLPTLGVRMLSLFMSEVTTLCCLYICQELLPLNTVLPVPVAVIS